MRLVEAGDVFFNGKLHRVVHLGGKGNVGGIQPGKCIVNGLVLLLVLCRGGIHAVQAFAVPGEQTQGQLPAHLGTHGGVQRFGHGVVIIGLAGIKDAAVTGVCPDGPHHAGGSKGDAGSIVDLAAGGLDGGIQQLLLCGQLAVGVTVFDLDIIQAVGHTGRSKAHDHKGQTAADQTGSGVHAGTGAGFRPGAFYFFDEFSEEFPHGMLLRQRAFAAFCRAFVKFGTALQTGCINRKSVRCRTLSRIWFTLQCQECSRHRCR